MLCGCGPGGVAGSETDAVAQGGTATLRWDAVPGSILGYRLYVGNAPQQYQSRIEVGLTTVYSIGNLQTNRIYYFAVTAYNAGGESPYSEEVSAEVQ